MKGFLSDGLLRLLSLALALMMILPVSVYTPGSVAAAGVTAAPKSPTPPSADLPSSRLALYSGRVLAGNTKPGETASTEPHSTAAILQSMALSGHIAFESDRTGDLGLYGHNADGSDATVTLLNTSANEVTPVWSPDGKELLYASDGDGDYEIYRRTSDGRSVQITDNQADDIHPAWSPSGAEILFSSNRDGANFGIYRIKPDGSDVGVVASEDGQNLLSPSYSPNGLRIAYMQASVLVPICQWNWDVWVMNVDGNGRRRITSSLAADLYPHWTPDGQKILYGACANLLDSDLYAINPDTGAVTKLVSWFLSNEWGGVYSPDSTHFAFNSDVGGQVDIYIEPAGGGAAVNLTNDPAGDLAASWSPARAMTAVGLGLQAPLDVTSPAKPFAPDAVTLQVRVKNYSSEAVTDALVRFYLGDPDAGGVLIGTAPASPLAAGQEAIVSVQWTLKGNLEDASIFTVVSSRANPVDSNPSDNKLSRKVSVHYADFRHDEDAYSFYNKEVGEITNGDLLTFLLQFDIPEVFHGLLAPVFGSFLEINGHCYGMSNSSIIYREYPDLRPVPTKNTADLTVEEARPKIRTYQWYALGPFLRIVLGLDDRNPQTQYQRTLDQIKAGRPVIQALFREVGPPPEKGSHAVVAYKIIDLGAEKRVYYYDNNIPLEELKTAGLVTYGVFSGGGFSEPFYKLGYYNAFAIEPQLSYSDDMRLLLLKLVESMLGALQSNSLLTVSAQGNVDLLAVDELGRRAGYVGATQYDEIPGATLTQLQGMQSLLLPLIGKYQVSVTGTLPMSAGSAIVPSDDHFTLNIVDPVSTRSAQVIQFADVTPSNGVRATVEFRHGQTTAAMVLPGGASVPPRSSLTVHDPLSPSYLPLIAR